ncbi:MAG TPA: hypothetical protein VFT79_03680 [Solirubrobacterales bacterium]|nr:hypothetical protein [Solirubrobacterales bacterium]
MEVTNKYLRPAAARSWHWAIPIAAILCLLAPILLTDRTFASDWGNHYWLIHMQGLDIRALDEPSIYLQSGLAAFYPYYAFYGGTFYAVTGFVSAAFGTELAVLLAYAGAIAANYLGWTWIARQAGIRGWRSQLPGLIAVTAPLAVTNLYGRGGIPEVIGTSMLPLVAASAISLVREPRMRLRDTVAFVVGLVFLTGSHTLSMVWGVALLALLGAVLIACCWSLVKERAMRLLGLAWLAVLAGCVNAWMLAPLIAYHARTIESEPDPIGQSRFTEPANLFRVLRDMPDVDPLLHGDVNAALPVLAIVWALVAGAVFWRRLAPRSRAMGIALTAVLVALVALILRPSLLSSLPEFLQYIQFPYRLLTYANFCAVGMVTLVLAGLGRRSSSPGSFAAVASLAAIALFSLAISVGQNSDVRSWLGGRDEAVASSPRQPPSWYAFLQFGDGAAPIMKPTLDQPLTVPVEEEIRDSYRVEYPPGPAGTAQTNIATGSYLVDVSGATPVGRDKTGQMIVRLPASPERPRPVEVSAKESVTVAAGRWLSVASILGALGALALTLTRRRRGRAVTDRAPALGEAPKPLVGQNADSHRAGRA